MPKLNKNEDGTISVLYQTRLKQHRLEEHIDAESFTLENNFHGDLNELVPRCFSSHYGIEVVLFQPTGRTSNLRLYSKYKEFGLIPDPIAQIRLNGDFPEIPRDYPNVSQWTYRTDRDYCSPFLHINTVEGQVIVKSDHAERSSLWAPGTWFCGTRPIPDRMG